MNKKEEKNGLSMCQYPNSVQPGEGKHTAILLYDGATIAGLDVGFTASDPSK